MNTATLVLGLQRESVRARSGAGIVSVLAIVSLTLGAAIAFLVAGGTWMFWQRAHHPEDAVPALRAAAGENPENYFLPWFVLALMACAFIVPALFNLTAQAAVLGASGREQRLSTLRLLGLSSHQVERMAAVETGIQALIGIVLGWLISVLIAPVFTHVKFQDRPVAFEEIILPWWGYLAVAAVLFLLALAAALAGMWRVRVSPLGVAKCQMPAAFRWWRLIAFLLIVTVGGVLLKGQSGTPEISMAVPLFAVIMSINLVAPYLLQIGARLLALLPGTAHLVACQRVNANARRAWRQSAAIGFSASSPAS
ncbi:FtsX-like permease family protein [uncultured Corynebacterium sp.]|uniref:FtsX-like permease family protein n=1 Tax=uncultured Corynebacterium sp. TaxID=159447 RepID=UPI0025E039A5|nr:FtsX-like permease family protein [uncultured Corynebacterium sp.]